MSQNDKDGKTITLHSPDLHPLNLLPTPRFPPDVCQTKIFRRPRNSACEVLPRPFARQRNLFRTINPTEVEHEISEIERRDARMVNSIRRSLMHTFVRQSNTDMCGFHMCCGWKRVTSNNTACDGDEFHYERVCPFNLISMKIITGDVHS